LAGWIAAKCCILCRMTDERPKERKLAQLGGPAAVNLNIGATAYAAR